MNSHWSAASSLAGIRLEYKEETRSQIENSVYQILINCTEELRHVRIQGTDGVAAGGSRRDYGGERRLGDGRAEIRRSQGRLRRRWIWRIWRPQGRRLRRLQGRLRRPQGRRIRKGLRRETSRERGAGGGKQLIPPATCCSYINKYDVKKCKCGKVEGYR